MPKGGMPGMPGGMNMNNLMKQAQKMQKQVEQMQQELELKTYEATAGGGAVRVVANGKKQLQELVISPDVLDDVEMLQDIVLAAVNEAVRQADEDMNAQMGRMGIPGLGGMF